MMRFVLAALFALTAGLAQAEVAAVYDFDTREQEVRYQNLIAELRCPKCQNQNIADSNAPISQDMRDEVYEMMQAGASNEEIVDALVARFGEFVRYKPELTAEPSCYGRHRPSPSLAGCWWLPAWSSAPGA